MKDILDAFQQVAAVNWALLVITLACLAGVGVAAEFMVDQQTAYQDAAAEAARCKKMARQILAARGSTPAVTPSGPNAVDDSAEIGSAASAAGMATDNFDRIEHEGSERVGSSSYVRGKTGISLKGVSLPEVVDFLDELRAAPAPLVAQSLRISPADQGGKQGDELWDAALSVVSVRYAPATGPGTIVRASAGGSAHP